MFCFQARSIEYTYGPENNYEYYYENSFDK